MDLIKIEDKIITFFKKMLSNDDSISSKRVVGFGAFVMTAIAWIVALCKGPIVPEFYWWGFLGLICTCFGLNAMVAMKGMSVKSNVASDVLKEDPSVGSTQAATEILKADKP